MTQQFTNPLVPQNQKQSDQRVHTFIPCTVFLFLCSDWTNTQQLHGELIYVYKQSFLKCYWAIPVIIMIDDARKQEHQM